MSRKIVIVLGPTAVGKTDYSISLAKKYSSPIISCDSRQIYREMRIGTAVPSDAQLAEVRHYFIRSHSVTQAYTAGMYEVEAMELIEKLFADGHDTLVVTGGSMFYIDALCNGIPDVPKGDLALRENLRRRLESEGVASLAAELASLDPEACSVIDLQNGARVMRALEICLISGKPFSSFRMDAPKKRPFEIEKIGLVRQRDDLYERINLRVDKMIEDGLEKEVRSLKEFRNLTALQTVGYKEMFDYFDNPSSISLAQTADLIRTHTRNYAKRQMTWWKRDTSIKWISL